MAILRARDEPCIMPQARWASLPFLATLATGNPTPAPAVEFGSKTRDARRRIRG